MAAHGDDTRVLAGGVDLLPRMRAGSVKAGHLVNIQRVADLDYMRRAVTGGIEFGAMASLHSLERWEDLRTDYGALYDAIHQITSVQTKYMGTAVGNICVATPASDVAPALAAYDAELVISGPDGDRRLPVSDFYPAYGQTALGRGELVIGVEVPPGSRRPRGHLPQPGAYPRGHRQGDGDGGGRSRGWHLQAERASHSVRWRRPCSEPVKLKLCLRVRK